MPTQDSIDTKTRLRIAAWLRCKMKELKITKRDAAKAIGVDEATVGRVINYGAPIGLDVVLGIHRGMHMDANRLLDFDPPAEFFVVPPSNGTAT